MRKKLFLLVTLALGVAAFAAQTPVNIGTTPNDSTGDPLRTAFTKLNANIAELYARTTITGSFTGTFTIGCTTQATGTINYQIDGSTVSMWVPANFTCTSNTNQLILSGLPAAVNPLHVHRVFCGDLEDNGAVTLAGSCRPNGDGTMVIAPGLVSGTSVVMGASGFTPSGGKGLFVGWTVVYPLG